MTPEQEARAIENAVLEYEGGGDDAVDEEVVIEEPTIDVHTQKIERVWREVKREFVYQHGHPPPDRTRSHWPIFRSFGCSSKLLETLVSLLDLIGSFILTILLANSKKQLFQ